jgi:flagellar biosynthesis protein
MSEKPEEPTSPYAPLKPSHGRSVAVAIQGTDGKPDSLPKIIASGRGKLAEQILELAFAKGLKVREDADLAELLAKLDLDTPIPSEAIIAVAEILAKVYEYNARPVTLTTPGALQESES